MQTKIKDRCIYLSVIVVIVLVLLIDSLVALTSFVTFENNLAVQIPQHITEQMQKRQETYVLENQISKYVKEAVVSSQDKRFYSNLGVDILATARALYFTLTTGNRHGASTITEQLGKNVFYHDKDTFKTDIETKILALFITFHFTKDKILEMYLNDIYYGKGAYGIAQASTMYFHTVPSKLTLSQAAYLIGLINAPSYLSDHPNQAKDETKIVLEEMVKNMFISKKQETVVLKNLVI